MTNYTIKYNCMSNLNRSTGWQLSYFKSITNLNVAILKHDSYFVYLKIIIFNKFHILKIQ